MNRKQVYEGMSLEPIKKKKLEEQCMRFNLSVSSETLKKIECFVQVATKWNKRINLFSRKEEEVLVERHIIDCIPLACLLRKNGKLIDVGSGGGFPGAIVGCFRKDVEITLVEPLKKRAAFLKEIRRVLSLSHLKIYENTVEELQTEETFTDCVSRAVFKPEEWHEIGYKLISQQGIVWFMLSKEQADEFTKIKSWKERADYTLDEGRKRVLIGIEKY